MRNLSEMVWSRELIEHVIKNKKLEEKVTHAPVMRVASTKKKEGETHAVFTNQQYIGHASYSNQPSYSTNNLSHVQPLSYQTSNAHFAP